jgi:hypothetical protein
MRREHKFLLADVVKHQVQLMEMVFLLVKIILQMKEDHLHPQQIQLNLVMLHQNHQTVAKSEFIINVFLNFYEPKF